MKSDPKPKKVAKQKMTSAEFRKKYGSKKAKPKSISKLKKEADKWFSRRVRLEAADDRGIGKCFDCGKVGEVKYMDCGHFWSRANNSTRWDLDNCRLQAKKCNWDMSRPEVNNRYREALIKDIGAKRFDELYLRHFNNIKITRFMLENIIEESKAVVLYLLGAKGLDKWW